MDLVLVTCSFLYLMEVDTAKRYVLRHSSLLLSSSLWPQDLWTLHKLAIWCTLVSDQAAALELLGSSRDPSNYDSIWTRHLTHHQRLVVTENREYLQPLHIGCRALCRKADGRRLLVSEVLWVTLCEGSTQQCIERRYGIESGMTYCLYSPLRIPEDIG